MYKRLGLAAFYAIAGSQAPQARRFIQPIRSPRCAKMHSCEGAEPLRSTLRSNQDRQTALFSRSGRGRGRSLDKEYFDKGLLDKGALGSESLTRWNLRHHRAN